MEQAAEDRDTEDDDRAMLNRGDWRESYVKSRRLFNRGVDTIDRDMRNRTSSLLDRMIVVLKEMINNIEHSCRIRQIYKSVRQSQRLIKHLG